MKMINKQFIKFFILIISLLICISYNNTVANAADSYYEPGVPPMPIISDTYDMCGSTFQYSVPDKQMETGDKKYVSVRTGPAYFIVWRSRYPVYYTDWDGKPHFWYYQKYWACNLRGVNYFLGTGDDPEILCGASPVAGVRNFNTSFDSASQIRIGDPNGFSYLSRQGPVGNGWQHEGIVPIQSLNNIVSGTSKGKKIVGWVKAGGPDSAPCAKPGSQYEFGVRGQFDYSFMKNNLSDADISSRYGYTQSSPWAGNWDCWANVLSGWGGDSYHGDVIPTISSDGKSITITRTFTFSGSGGYINLPVPNGTIWQDRFGNGKNPSNTSPWSPVYNDTYESRFYPAGPFLYVIMETARNVIIPSGGHYMTFVGELKEIVDPNDSSNQSAADLIISSNQTFLVDDDGIGTSKNDPLKVKAGYGIPISSEHREFNYIPDHNCCCFESYPYMDTFLITGIKVDISTNLNDDDFWTQGTNSFLENFFPWQQTYGIDKARMVAYQHSMSPLQKRKIYTRPSQADGLYWIRLDATTNVQFDEEVPDPGCDCCCCCDCDADADCGCYCCCTGTHREYAQPHTCHDAVILWVKIEDSMFDDDQQVVEH